MKGIAKKGLLAGLVALAIPIAFGGAAQGEEPLVVTGLQAPRGLTASDARVIVAEQGAGRILRVSPNGTYSVIADGLPAVITESPEGPAAGGVTAAIEVNGTFYFTLGEAIGEEGFDAVYKIERGGEPELVADIHAYEQANNVDGGTDEAGDPDLVVNLYDLVSDGADGLYVSASGANAIFHVDGEGTITPFAIFEDRDNPLFPGMGGPTMDQVPTGLEWGPDGALYVSTLTGFPFPDGGARVYRMADANDDGDALDGAETSVYADGLTTATNLAFAPDGMLLVTEFSTNMLEGAPGRLVSVANGEVSEVAAPLVSPTGLAALDNGTVIVNMEFLGIVGDPDALAAIAAAGPGGPPPAEGGEGEGNGGGGITPPSTGDAGLIDRSAGSWMMLAGIGVLLSSLGLATFASVRKGA